MLLSVLFLPGTFLHEVSHFFMAHLLRVPVGKMSLTPHIEEKSILMGSVSIAKTDIVRRFLIGVAPFVVGIGIICGGLFFLISSQEPLSNIWTVLLLCYIIFEIGNTMYSSKRDLEGAVELLLIVGSVLLTLLLLGIPVYDFVIWGFSYYEVQQTFRIGSVFLLAPIVIDIVIILLFLGVRKLSKG